MAKTFKNIPSLHRLLESAPLESVRDLLLNVDEQEYAACFGDVEWPEADATDDIVEASRLAVLEVAASLQPDAGVPLEQHASRILNLAEGRGVEAVAKVADRIFDSANSAAFEQQRDDYGRAIYLYLLAGGLLDHHDGASGRPSRRVGFELPDPPGASSQYNATATLKDRKLVVLPRAEGKTASGKSLPVIRLSPNEVTSYRLTFPDRGSVGAVKTLAHDTKTGKKIDIVIPNPDAPAGSSSATHTDRHIYPNPSAAKAAAKAKLAGMNRQTTIG